MKNLKLFYMERCPFCNKVKKYIEDNDINIEMVDIYVNSKNEEELIRLGGKDQVPMLLIDGEPLYESDDIIEWFKNNM